MSGEGLDAALRRHVLTGRQPTDVVCYRDGVPVTMGTLLGHAAALAAVLPESGPAVNACGDRYLSQLGFVATLMRGHATLLGAARSVTPAFWQMAALRQPGVYVLADAAIPATTLPIVRLDRHPLDAAPTAPGVLRPIPPERIVAIAFTSGSTGEPAPHPKSWGALVAGADAAAERFGFRPEDGAPTTIVATVPPQHMYGFETTMMLPLRASVSVHAGESFFPADVLAALAGVPPRRVLVTTPLHLRALLAEGRPPAPLAAVISATAPLARDTAQAVERAWAAPMLEIYGATEAGSVASRRTVQDDTWQPYRGVDVRPGLIVVPGIGEVPLADMIEPDGAGRFALLGRQTDVVKLGGKRASLADLNRTLGMVEGVVDGVLVAPEDIETNPAARLTAYVVAPGRSAEHILGALRSCVDPVFLPRRVVMMDALPRDAVGKLPRQALAAAGAGRATKHARD